MKTPDERDRMLTAMREVVQKVDEPDGYAVAAGALLSTNPATGFSNAIVPALRAIPGRLRITA
jgi:hypothetical protein